MMKISSRNSDAEQSCVGRETSEFPITCIDLAWVVTYALRMAYLFEPAESESERIRRVLKTRGAQLFNWLAKMVGFTLFTYGLTVVIYSLIIIVMAVRTDVAPNQGFVKAARKFGSATMQEIFRESAGAMLSPVWSEAPRGNPPDVYAVFKRLRGNEPTFMQAGINGFVYAVVGMMCGRYAMHFSVLLLPALMYVGTERMVNSEMLMRLAPDESQSLLILVVAIQFAAVYLFCLVGKWTKQG